MFVGTPYLFGKTKEKIPKNAQKREKKRFQKLSIFQPMTLGLDVRFRKLKLFRYLKNISISKQKIGAKIMINNKDIKVLLTEDTKPTSKIIETFLTIKNHL